MSVYNIANLNIKIVPKSKYVSLKLLSYITNAEDFDFDATVSIKDIKYEIQISEYDDEAMAEFIAIFRKICKTVLIRYNGMFLHSAAVKYKNKAYLFSAPSGIGKTTHVRLWKAYLGSQVEIINGDKPLLREENGIINVYGNPWQGKEDYGCNTYAPLGGILILERAAVNSASKAPTTMALKSLLSQTLRPNQEEYVNRLFDFLSKILKTIPIINLKCNISQEAVQTALNAIEKYL